MHAPNGRPENLGPNLDGKKHISLPYFHAASNSLPEKNLNLQIRAASKEGAYNPI
jgi:hypothetical protein